MSTTDENTSTIADDAGDEGAESSDRNNGVETRINQSMKFRRSRSEDNRSSQVPMGLLTKEMFTRYPPSKQHFQTNPTQQRSKIVSKQNQHQAKKKFKLSNNADVNDENVICSDYAKGDKVLIPESASCKHSDQILNCQVSEIGTKVTEVVSEISGDTVYNQRKLEHNVLSRTENDLIINKQLLE